ncbi:MAG: hypothetical protein V4530_04280 [Pseudomonadota bacterium]
MRFIILAAFAGLAACGQTATPADANKTSTVETPAPAAAPVAETASASPKVTKAEVAKLKEGMTYDEVKAIMGREGEVGNSENGTESISWANTDGSSLQTTFRDGKLVVFTDFGMK